MKLQTPKEAFFAKQKRLPRYHQQNHFPTSEQNIGVSCPECDNVTIVCCRGGYGGTCEQVDLYWHVCLYAECSYIHHWSVCWSMRSDPGRSPTLPCGCKET